MFFPVAIYVLILCCNGKANVCVCMCMCVKCVCVGVLGIEKYVRNRAGNLHLHVFCVYVCVRGC